MVQNIGFGTKTGVQLLRLLYFIQGKYLTLPRFIDLSKEKKSAQEESFSISTSTEQVKTFN